PRCRARRRRTRVRLQAEAPSLRLARPRHARAPLRPRPPLLRGRQNETRGSRPRGRHAPRPPRQARQEPRRPLTPATIPHLARYVNEGRPALPHATHDHRGALLLSLRDTPLTCPGIYGLVKKLAALAGVRAHR